MSLLPEKPLSFSPQLAATLGLEEAVLLQTLYEVECHQAASSNTSDLQWINLDEPYLSRLLPFWQIPDIARIAQNLQSQGVLLVESPTDSATILRFALNDKDTAQPQSQPQPQPAPVKHQVRGTQLIKGGWQPETDVVAQLVQYGVPQHFIAQQIPEFITYWSERGEPHYSWGSKFLKQVIRLWREQQTKDARQQKETLITNQWRPSSDAIDILTRQAAINGNFIEDAIPEFILYWQDRGTRSSTWNSQFIQHVRRQWIRYTSTIEHNSDPHVIRQDWQPGEDLYEVLRLANIPKAFAQQQIPSFVLYWRETATPHNSWNTKFLQHVKRQWAYGQSNQVDTNNGQQQRLNKAVSTRNTSLSDDLTDRSWAS